MKVENLYFAMVDEATVFDPAVHNVVDLQVFTCEIAQKEGEFPQATLEIPNPGVGLLNPSRKQYLFISCLFDSAVVPLFFGRVVGIPSAFDQRTITVQYISQKSDWLATQTAFLAGLQVAPYYNVLFSALDTRDDPVEILAGRGALLHWSRFPGGGLALSDIVQGATAIDLTDQFFYDSLTTRIGNPPLQTVDCTVQVQWTQTATANVDVGTPITQAFVNTGGAPSPQINSLTPAAFEAAWNGVKIPTGYTMVESSLVPTTTAFGLTPFYLVSEETTVSSQFFPAAKNTAVFFDRPMALPRTWYLGTLVLNALYSQKRREVMAISLSATTQNIALSVTNVQALSVTLQDPTSPDQGAPLDPGKPTFFYDPITLAPTSYGQAVMEHTLMRARAVLTKSARAIETSFEVPLSSTDVLNMTCDQSVHISDSRLPGGQIRGKIIAYSLLFSDVDLYGKVTLGSMIGTGVSSSGAGTALAPVAYDNQPSMSVGSSMTSEVIYSLTSPPAPTVPVDVPTMLSTPTYLVDGVTVANNGDLQNSSVFALQNQIVNPPAMTATMAFESIDVTGLTPGNVTVYPTIISGTFVQFAQNVKEIQYSASRPDLIVAANATALTVDLKSMNPVPEYLLEFEVDTQLLTFPQHIDLGSS